MRNNHLRENAAEPRGNVSMTAGSRVDTYILNRFRKRFRDSTFSRREALEWLTANGRSGPRSVALFERWVGKGSFVEETDGYRVQYGVPDGRTESRTLATIEARLSRLSRRGLDRVLSSVVALRVSIEQETECRRVAARAGAAP
jgi:CRISPR/Cas system-associated endoribonuclease Cas2